MQGITGVATQTRSTYVCRSGPRPGGSVQRCRPASDTKHAGRSREPKSNVAHIVITDKVAPDDIHAWLADPSARTVTSPMANIKPMKICSQAFRLRPLGNSCMATMVATLISWMATVDQKMHGKEGVHMGPDSPSFHSRTARSFRPSRSSRSTSETPRPLGMRSKRPAPLREFTSCVPNETREAGD